MQLFELRTQEGPISIYGISDHESVFTFLIEKVYVIQKIYPYNFFMQVLKSFFSCWYQQAVKQAKNVLLACFRAYVGQPDRHVCRVELHQCLLYKFVLLTQAPIPDIFAKILRIGGIE